MTSHTKTGRSASCVTPISVTLESRSAGELFSTDGDYALAKAAWKPELNMRKRLLNVKKSVIEKSKRLLVAPLYSTDDIRKTHGYIVWRKEENPTRYVTSLLGIINGIRDWRGKPYWQIRFKEGDK